MFKSNKKRQPWPWRVRGIYLVLGVSLLLNAITLSFVTFLSSPYADYALLSHSYNQACVRDYDKHLNAITTTSGKILFSEAQCSRDAATGKFLNTARIVDGHYVLR